MKRFLSTLAIIFAICFPSLLRAQTDNTVYVKQFAQPGWTVGQMATAAQAQCVAGIPCIIVFDPSLAGYSQGSMPSKCSLCIWQDYRTAVPTQGAVPVVPSNNGVSQLPTTTVGTSYGGQPFTFGTSATVFNGTTDNTYTFGYNCVPGAADPAANGVPALCNEMEIDYNDGSHHYLEWHTDFYGTNSSNNFRLMQIDYDIVSGLSFITLNVTNVSNSQIDFDQLSSTGVAGGANNFFLAQTNPAYSNTAVEVLTSTGVGGFDLIGNSLYAGGGALASALFGPTAFAGTNMALVMKPAYASIYDLTHGIDGGGPLTLSYLEHGIVYSAAGTALPTCNSAAKGYQAVVSDATSPTFNATYTSGGAVVAAVTCNGSNWVTQ